MSSPRFYLSVPIAPKIWPPPLEMSDGRWRREWMIAFKQAIKTDISVIEISASISQACVAELRRNLTEYSVQRKAIDPLFECRQIHSNEVELSIDVLDRFRTTALVAIITLNPFSWDEYVFLPQFAFRLIDTLVGRIEAIENQARTIWLE